MFPRACCPPGGRYPRTTSGEFSCWSLENLHPNASHELSPSLSSVIDISHKHLRCLSANPPKSPSTEASSLNCGQLPQLRPAPSTAASSLNCGQPAPSTAASSLNCGQLPQLRPTALPQLRPTAPSTAASALNCGQRPQLRPAPSTAASALNCGQRPQLRPAPSTAEEEDFAP